MVIVAGAALGTPGTMNGIVIHTVGEQWTGDMESEIPVVPAIDAGWA